MKQNQTMASETISNDATNFPKQFIDDVKTMFLLCSESTDAIIAQSIVCEITGCELICSSKKCVAKVKELNLASPFFILVTFQGQSIELDINDSCEEKIPLTPKMKAELELFGPFLFVKLSLDNCVRYLPIFTNDISKTILSSNKFLCSWKKRATRIGNWIWKVQNGETEAELYGDGLD